MATYPGVTLFKLPVRVVGNSLQFAVGVMYNTFNVCTHCTTERLEKWEPCQNKMKMSLVSGAAVAAVVVDGHTGASSGICLQCLPSIIVLTKKRPDCPCSKNHRRQSCPWRCSYGATEKCAALPAGCIDLDSCETHNPLPSIRTCRVAKQCSRSRRRRCRCRCRRHQRPAAFDRSADYARGAAGGG